MPTVLSACVAATGGASLCLEVTWQRVIALQTGVDLGSMISTTTSFLAGLGIGALLGGRWADRLDARGAMRRLGLVLGATSVISGLSVPMLSEVGELLQRRGAHDLTVFSSYLAIVVLLTVLHGAVLPLVARCVVLVPEIAGKSIGRYNGAATVGGAFGAFTTAYVLVGGYGLQGSATIAAVVQLVAALILVVLARSIRSASTRPAVVPAVASDPLGVPTRARRLHWLLSFSFIGATSLGLQQIFFRFIDVEMRSSSYSFGHVLGLYLVLAGAGSVLGSQLVAADRDLGRWFARLQLVAGCSVATGMIVVVHVLPRLGLEATMSAFYAGGGLRGGMGISDGAWRESLGFGVAIPVILIAVPVFALGATFPLVVALVTDRTAVLGRRVGAVTVAGIAGNVVGSLLVGFFLIDRWGSPTVARVLAGVLIVVSGVTLLRIGTKPMRLRAAGAVTVGIMLVALAPSNGTWWAFFHATAPGRLLVEEDRSCLSALRLGDGVSASLVLGGAPQNDYPFDDFHVMIGLLPALAGPDAGSALAVGFGIGSTTFGMLAVSSVKRVDTVELCGGNYRLARELAQRGAVEFRRMFDDPRRRFVTGDGREVLLRSRIRYDVVTVDTLLPQSAFSGNTYSKDFYQLVSDRLKPDGLFTQWLPTGRTLRGVAAVFPHVVTVEVASYGSTFLVASRSPIRLDARQLVDRFDDQAAPWFEPAQRAAIRRLLGDLPLGCVDVVALRKATRSDQVNTDLHPRDEYFLNNPWSPPPHVAPCAATRERSSLEGRGED